MNNNFNIDDKIYDQLIKDNGYFKGFVVAKLISIEKRLDTGDRTFGHLEKQINRNRWYIALGVGGITVLAFLIKWIF